MEDDIIGNRDGFCRWKCKAGEINV